MDDNAEPIDEVVKDDMKKDTSDYPPSSDIMYLGGKSVSCPALTSVDTDEDGDDDDEEDSLIFVDPPNMEKAISCPAIGGDKRYVGEQVVYRTQEAFPSAHYVLERASIEIQPKYAAHPIYHVRIRNILFIPSKPAHFGRSRRIRRYLTITPTLRMAPRQRDFFTSGESRRRAGVWVAPRYPQACCSRYG